MKRFDPVAVELARREHLPLVAITIDKRYCDPPSGAIEFDGAVSHQVKASALVALQAAIDSANARKAAGR